MDHVITTVYTGSCDLCGTYNGSCDLCGTYYIGSCDLYSTYNGSCDPCRSEACTLLLCHGADPTLTNCHSKSALDLAASAELQSKIECKLIG